MRLLIDDARVWDGTGAAPFPGKVLIDGERIAAVVPQSEPPRFPTWVVRVLRRGGWRGC